MMCPKYGTQEEADSLNGFILHPLGKQLGFVGEWQGAITCLVPVPLQIDVEELCS